MRVLMTGSNGTVGRALGAALSDDGHEVVGWDRGEAAAWDGEAGQRLVERVRPDVVVHLAVASSPTGREGEGREVSVGWTVRLATLCREVGARFVFTSTAMVFTDGAAGPFTVDSEPDAVEGYGGEKAEAERLVAAANGEALVVRLGWQIGESAGSNNIVDYLETRQREEGVVRASREWKPSAAFLGDTAAALAGLVESDARGVRMIEGNRAGHSFYEIARALSERRHGGKYVIEATDDFVFDQRMLDDRVGCGQVGERLGLG